MGRGGVGDLSLPERSEWTSAKSCEIEVCIQIGEIL